MQQKHYNTEPNKYDWNRVFNKKTARNGHERKGTNGMN